MKYDNIDLKHLPEHIGIIMDGNGRYAKKLGLDRTDGHNKGSLKLIEIAKHADQLGIKYMTVYAFSTENFKRPASEVNGIMKLLKHYLTNWRTYMGNNHIKINVIGDISDFDISLRTLIKYITEQTKNEPGLIMNIALGYGGRDEIVKAARKISSDIMSGVISADDVNEEMFSKYLYTKNIPDPDLIIRPGGEIRLSNFLTWQSAYSELWFSETLWPEFSCDDLEHAIYDFQKRHRRFGGL